MLFEMLKLRWRLRLWNGHLIPLIWNTIENLWALLKAKIYELRPDLIHMRNNDETKEILVATAQEAWDKLDIWHLQHISETMPLALKLLLSPRAGIPLTSDKNQFHGDFCRPYVTANRI